MLKVGLIGFGHVGQGVYRIIRDNASLISSRVGQDIMISKIAVRSLEKYQDRVHKDVTLTTRVDDLLDDDEIDIIVEVIGGEFPAYDYISKALSAKKHVVTANKEVISKHKKHFFELAKQHGVDIYFEAAVGGGIPVIRSLKVGLAANQINEYFGILNGTTNYILTKIEQDQQSFATILKTAQELGLAEADPTMDVSGLDAAYKCVILAAVAFKINVQLDDLYYEGIENVTLRDVQYAKSLGYRIKLLAFGKRCDGGTYQLSVYPALIPLEHPLASVQNEFNAVYAVGDFVGESMLVGKGAGGAPTGSAVVSDIMDVAFNEGTISQRNLETVFTEAELKPFDESESAFFFRLLVEDQPGALEQVSALFAQHGISIETLIQKEKVDGYAQLVIVTASMKESACHNLVSALEEVPSLKEVSSRLRLVSSL